METTVAYCYSAHSEDVSRLSASAPQSREGIISFHGNTDIASDAGEIERKKGEWVEGKEEAVSNCSAGCVGGKWRCVCFDVDSVTVETPI